MKLLDVNNFITNEVDVIVDCDFERTYLVGKEFDKNHKLISFIGDTKYVDSFLKYDIAGVICNEETAKILKTRYNGGIAVAREPKTAFFEIHNHIGLENKKYVNSHIDPTAIVHERAIIADKNVYIGKNTYIAANVIIKEDTHIGDNCIIREGCILGTPAFYYYGEDDGRRQVECTGGIILENNVEMHANCIVEKGVMYGNTVISDNTKLDNLCLVGHDSNIGRDCTIAGQTVFAGGVKVGDNSFAGVGVCVAPNINIGKNTKLSSRSVVTKDVSDNKHVSGNFAIDHEKFLENLRRIR